MFLRNSAEGGTNSTTVTAANSGGSSGNAWDQNPTIGSGAALIYSNTVGGAHGSLAYKLTTGASSVTCFEQWTSTSIPSSPSTIYWRCYVYLTANPGATLAIVKFLDSGATTQSARFQINTNGKVQHVNSAGAAGTSTMSVPLNQWFRLEGKVVIDPTNGLMEVKIFSSLDSLTPDETKTSATGQNTGSSVQRAQWGFTVAGANLTAYMDDMAVSDVDYIGPALVIGGQAPETDTASAGTAAVVVAGSQASETDTANSGTAVVTVAGAQPAETDTANPGTPRVIVAGSQPAETDTANAGTARVTTDGSLATETDTGNAGAPRVVVAGSLATETDIGNPGSGGADVIVSGAQASESDTANRGAPLVTAPGAQASETDTGRTGAPLVVRPGGQASESDTAFAGVIRATWPGALATETDTPNSGAALVAVAGAQATESDEALARTIATVVGSLSSSTATGRRLTAAHAPAAALTGDTTGAGPLTATDQPAAELVGSDS